MKSILKLFAIGLFGGLVLMLFLKLIMLINGNTAYDLLFNFDYIPVVKDLEPVHFFGYVFHFLTCVVSVWALFYILKSWEMEHHLWPYIVVYSVGGGVLFFLTALSPQLPESTDVMAWLYWTLGHALFGVVIGISLKKWM